MAFGVSVYSSSAATAPHVADDRIDARTCMHITVVTCWFTTLQLSELERQNQSVLTRTVLTLASVCSVCMQMLRSLVVVKLSIAEAVK